MPKKDLEQLFVDLLDKNNVSHSGKIFSCTSATFIADYIFSHLVVFVIDKYSKAKSEKVHLFKKLYPTYSVIILANDCGKFMDDRSLDEVYDRNSLGELVKKLKRHND